MTHVNARRLADAHGVRVNFADADCDSFVWPQAACDGVAAIFVQFADPALRERLFRRIVKSLKPGGTLVLQGYTPKQLEYEADITEGSAHAGRSALIGMVARRPTTTGA